MTSYFPDVWVIVEISGDLVKDTHHRVLVGFFGGYLDGDSWKMNSGISKIIEVGDIYEIYGVSGSIYRCHKQSEDFSGYTAEIYDRLLQQSSDDISVKHVNLADIIQRYRETSNG